MNGEGSEGEREGGGRGEMKVLYVVVTLLLYTMVTEWWADSSSHMC